MSELKTKRNEQSVEGFLNSIPDETKRRDCFALKELMEDITASPAVMWGDSIVGFGSYCYRYASGREGEWFLTGFSPRKQNLTLYIMSGFSGYDGLLEDLGKYKTGKSCLYIKRMDDVHLDTLRELVKRSVQHMVETNP